MRISDWSSDVCSSNLFGAGLRLPRCAASFLSEYPARRFDCLITDIRMPGMTGIELIELLHDTGQSLPTVILTSIVDERAHARSAALGAHAWLTKPVTDERLLAALASAIHTQLPHSDLDRKSTRLNS